MDDFPPFTGHLFLATIERWWKIRGEEGRGSSPFPGNWRKWEKKVRKGWGGGVSHPQENWRKMESERGEEEKIFSIHRKLEENWKWGGEKVGDLFPYQEEDDRVEEGGRTSPSKETRGKLIKGGEKEVVGEGVGNFSFSLQVTTGISTGSTRNTNR